MDAFTDQTGRTIQLHTPPQRIVSLVPSQTELLYHLGLDKEVHGITKFCIHPNSWFNSKIRVGGTKALHIEKIKSLKPDLIIANKEENVKDQVEELLKDFPVWISDIATYEDALKMISGIGSISAKEAKAKELINAIEDKFSNIEKENKNILSAAYLIWKDPYMTVGGDTFIHDMMQRGGFINVFSNKHRYPQITMEQIAMAKPEVLLLSSEPYPFSQKHINEIQPNLPQTKIVLVDGELFSWYGSRMLLAATYLNELQQQIKAL